MALIGEMKYLQIGSNTYEIPTSELPIASSSTLGGIKVGTNLSIDSNTGVLSVTGIPTKISDITTYDNFGIGYIDCSSSDRFIFVSNVKFGSSGDSDYSSPFLLMFQNGSARSGTVTIPGSGNFRFYNINTNQLLNYYTSVNYTNLQYGKLYIAYMSDNRLVIKSIAEITDIPTISITRNLTSGTKSATINISGTDYDIYSTTPPSAATTAPVVDGTAAVGSSSKYAKEDHVHPTDTSRAAATTVATQASISNTGLITYKNSSGTSLFTLQLPLYNGGVS